MLRIYLLVKEVIVFFDFNFGDVGEGIGRGRCLEFYSVIDFKFFGERGGLGLGYGVCSWVE